MLAESERMNKERFPNKKFRRFINITQLMIFSNNMEYDALGGIVPVQGAFYCTGARSYAPFNCFREENLSGQKIAPFHRDYPYRRLTRRWKNRYCLITTAKSFIQVRNIKLILTSIHLPTEY